MLCSLWCHHVMDVGAHTSSFLPSIKDKKSLILLWIMQQDWTNIFPTGFPSAPAAHTPINICILWWFSWTMSFSLRNLLQHNSPQHLMGSSEWMFDHYCFSCLTSFFILLSRNEPESACTEPPPAELCKPRAELWPVVFPGGRDKWFHWLFTGWFSLFAWFLGKIWKRLL